MVSTCDIIAKKNDSENIFITIAIPHYRYRENLQIAVESLVNQEFSNFEILVSDDASPCDAHKIVPEQLLTSGINFIYYRHASNIGYDRNVRFCLSNAKGRYVFLLGNDDALVDSKVLQNIFDDLQSLKFPEVAFTSYSDYVTRQLFQRAQSTRIIGTGPDTAVKIFRSFSFVSGLIFDKMLSQKYDTNIWDKSIYYQFYLATKIICNNGRVASLCRNSVYINTAINGVKVLTASPHAGTEWSFKPRYNGMDSVLRVVINTVIPYFDKNKQSVNIFKIILQIYAISYPYNLFYYRVNRNWSYSVGVARRMRPAIIFSEYKYPVLDEAEPRFKFSIEHRILLDLVYTCSTIVGLFLPMAIFNYYKPFVGNLVRKLQQK